MLRHENLEKIDQTVDVIIGVLQSAGLSVADTEKVLELVQEMVDARKEKHWEMQSFQELPIACGPKMMKLAKDAQKERKAYEGCFRAW